MSIEANVAADNREVMIKISGRFDFNMHRDFREAVKTVSKDHRCTVDMSEATYLDSSALGMLLLLKDEAEHVKIVHCSSDVRKVLEIANFHRLFELS